MKLWVTVILGPHDRPLVEVSPAAGEVSESIIVKVHEELSLTGERADIERWVRDLATQIAMQEAT